mmetsp:Transcript_35121/g.67934  ORF Transcript_35121/g.67934 Transcript_35121/m.67934 type:complete len:507 (+) Transcript_35121:102-1622(+)
MTDYNDGQDPVTRREQSNTLRRGVSNLRINTRVALTRKTSLGTIEKDPEEGSVSYRSYSPPSSFRTNRRTMSSAFGGKPGSRFDSPLSYVKKKRHGSSGSLGHMKWTPKGGVSISKDASPRFSKGGIYKKASTDNLGRGHETIQAKGGPSFALQSGRKEKKWLRNKGNPRNEGETSAESTPVRSSFNSKKTDMDSAFAGKIGGRFSGHGSHLSGTNKEDNREMTGQSSWKTTKKGAMDLQKSPRFNKIGSIYREANTDSVGMGHATMKAKGGPDFSHQSARKEDWLRNKGNPENEGEASAEAAVVRSSFASDKKCTAFSGKVGSRFSDPQSHLAGTNKVDTRESLGQKEWVGDGSTSKISQAKRFDAPGGIYKAAATDSAGLSHEQMAPKREAKKGGVISQQKRNVEDWLATPGDNEDGAETFLTSPVPSDFDTAASKKPSASFSGTKDRFQDPNSHLKKANQVDTRDFGSAHTEWRTNGGAAMSAGSPKSRFETPGSIYKSPTRR